MPPILSLQSVEYSLLPLNAKGRTTVRRIRNDDFAPDFSEGGAQPSSLSIYKTKIFHTFKGGFGRDRIDSDSANVTKEYSRFFDATADTRWNNTYPGILNESTTYTGLEVIRASTEHKGDLFALWEDGAGKAVVSRRLVGTTWQDGGNVIVNDSALVVASDLISYKGRLIALTAANTNHFIYDSADGVTWAVPGTTPIATGLLATTVTMHDGVPFGLLIEIGGEAVAVVWHEDSGTITFFSSTDPDVWTDETVEIPAGGTGPHGVAVFPDIDGIDKLWVACDTGLYVIDTSPATWTLDTQFPFVSGGISAGPGRRLAVHNGALYHAQVVGENSPAIVRKITIENDKRVIEHVGLTEGDGVPTDMLGIMRYLKSSGQFLYASVGGKVTERKGRVICWDGRAWHSMFQNGTENEEMQWIEVSSESDGTERLLYAIRTSNAVTAVSFLANPNTNPESVSAVIKRQLTSYVDLPYIDMGFPLEQKTWLRVGINAKGLSATNSGEFINVDRDILTDLGATGTRGSFTNLGDFLSGVNRVDLSSTGIAGLAMAERVNLISDTADTDAAVLKDVQIDALIKLDPTRRYEFLVDLEASRGLTGQGNKTPLDNLNTSETSKIKVALTYADLGTVQVNVESVTYSEEIVGEPGSTADPNAKRRGTAHVVVSQIP